MVISSYKMTMSSSSWSIAAAKARFSAVVLGARKSPQRITRRGRDVAVVVSAEQYERLANLDSRQGEHPMRTFLAFCEELRQTGDLDLRLPPRRVRRARPDPFRSKR